MDTKSKLTKKNIIIAVIGILIVFGAVGVLLILRGEEDTWICEKGQWVQHGQPSSPVPNETCVK